MDNRKKELIEKAKKDETIMGICHDEYLADYGKPPPVDWTPSDNEIFKVASIAGLNLKADNFLDNPMPTAIIGGNIKNKYMLIDIKKEEVILEFQETDEDSAIAYVFKLYNPPHTHYNLYQLKIDTDENSNFKDNARLIDLPSEITEDGDYIFS